MPPVPLTTGLILVERDFHLKWSEATETVYRHPLWHDPFVTALRDYEANPDHAYTLVKAWVQQMYHGSLTFPRYVGNLISRVENHSASRLLAINAAVERGFPDESRSHFLLAVNLLMAMEMSSDEIAHIPNTEYSRRYIDSHLECTKNEPLAKAIGCLGIGIEALTTREFSLLGNVYLKTAKGLAEEVFRSQGYFTENIMADAQHTSEFESIAYILWKAGEVPRDIRETMELIEEGAEFSLDQRRLFFQGIYEST